MLAIGNTIFWLTLWFASPAGFWGATIASAATFILGYVILVRHEEKQPLNVWVKGSSRRMPGPRWNGAWGRCQKRGADPISPAL